MNKRIVAFSILLLMMCAMAASVFAESLQCTDPDDGLISISFIGDTVRAQYQGVSAQTFQVTVLRKDGGTDVLNFSFPQVAAMRTESPTGRGGYKKNVPAQTRPDQVQRASGPIDKIYKCDWKTPY